MGIVKVKTRGMNQNEAINMCLENGPKLWMLNGNGSLRKLFVAKCDPHFLKGFVDVSEWNSSISRRNTL